MNNLVLASLAFASAGVLWFTQHHSVQAARTTNRSLNQELAAARAAYEETMTAVTNEEHVLAIRRQELDSARHELAAVTDATQSTPVPPDPASEGLWPKDKSYCYLAKQHLATIGFVPFSEDAGLTSEAAILFGMSPAEKSAVDNAYQDFLERTHQLHLDRAERIEPKREANNDNHREIAYRIPALTNEFRALRSAFDANAQQILGNSRADLFLKRAQPQLDEAFGQFDNGYMIKYSADREGDGSVKHQLKIEKLDRQGSSGYGIHFPIEPTSGMWKYRHLFGEEPLLQ